MRVRVPGSPKYRHVVLLVSIVVALAGTVLASPSALASPPNASSRRPIPTSAFKSTTGVTHSTITIGNVSTETEGLFTGSIVGTEAYAAYVNSQGGVDGRKLVVDAQNDQFAGAMNKELTENAVSKDFALVGSFSLEDSFGETVLAANPKFPDVSTSLDSTLAQLPNSYSANPTGQGWPTGAVDFYGREYPTEAMHTGVLASTFGSALAVWKKEEVAVEHGGYKIVYFDTVPLTQTDFTQNVVAMKNAGVKLILIDQLPENYAGALLKALNQQNFHPKLVIGTAAYSEALVAAAGGPAAADGSNLEMPNALVSGGGRFDDPGGQHLLEVGAESLPWLQSGLLHPCRMGQHATVRPGTQGSRQGPHAGIRTATAPENHVVRRIRPPCSDKSRRRKAFNLLRHRQDRQWKVRARR